jgi:hypothetical protein
MQKSATDIICSSLTPEREKHLKTNRETRSVSIKSSKIIASPECKSDLTLDETATAAAATTAAATTAPPPHTHTHTDGPLDNKPLAGAVSSFIARQRGLYQRI